jgi:hypothetical protein
LLDGRGHRAIGVVYRPELEGYGNYVPTVLPRRYDVFLFVDESRAVRALHMRRRAEEEEVPATFPSGVCPGGLAAPAGALRRYRSSSP